MSIVLEKVDYFYALGSQWEKAALEDISFNIEPGKILGITGPSGAGKSTLMQICNGNLLASRGTVTVDGVDIKSLKGTALVNLRRRVALVGQIAEKQIFERSIFADIAFGPRNLGLDKDQVQQRVRQAMEQIGLGFQEWKDRSPFHLSSGQKRRVAIAGVLAMRPVYLLLDEPTAGLDWEGRLELCQHLLQLKEELGGIVIISHRLEELLLISDELLFLDRGQIKAQGATLKVIEKLEDEINHGEGLTPSRQVLKVMATRGFQVNTHLSGAPEVSREIIRVLGGGDKQNG